MGFRLNTPYVQPYYLGSGSVASISSGVWEVALAGQQFMLDWSADPALRYAPVPFQRQQSDTADKPGEHTINPEGLWRRYQESWHLGAGQEDFDRKDSSEFRFRDSKGAYVWDRWQWSLLPDTDIKHGDANSNLFLEVAGSRLYYSRGQVLEYITDITVDTPIRTAVTGTPAATLLSLASNGFHIFAAYGASGIYRTDRTIGAAASQVTGTVDLVRYVRNRVMCAGTNNIYDATAVAMGGAPAALPAALFTHANTDFRWVDFAEGNGFIYAAGFSGDKSLIYKITLVAEGTALGAPSVAAELPDGELITHIRGYLGNFLYIGTSKGYRLGVVTDNGDLRLGALVQTPMSVLCSEPQEDFIWYGLGNFDGVSSGLGRLSTNYFTDIDRLVPAYASDLMATAQANAVNVVTFQGLRVFTLSQVGLYAEHQTRLVSEGHIDTGRITYGMTEPKIGVWFNLQHSEELGEHEILVSYDESPFQTVGSHTTDDLVHAATQHFLGIVPATSFEFRLKLTRDPVDNTSGLVFRSWLLRAQVTAEPTDYIFATVLIADTVEDLSGVPQTMNPYETLQFLSNMRRHRLLGRWQQNVISYNVFLEDFELDYKRLMEADAGHKDYNGSCLLKMKVVN